MGKVGVQEGRKKGGFDAVYRLPHRIWDVVSARCGGVGGLGEGPGYLFRGEGGIVLIVLEAEERGRWGFGGEEVVRREPISESCEITQADNLNRRRRLSRKAQ